LKPDNQKIDGSKRAFKRKSYEINANIDPSSSKGKTTKSGHNLSHMILQFIMTQNSVSGYI